MSQLQPGSACGCSGNCRNGLARGEILPRPESAQGVTHRLDTGCGKIYLTVNYQPENGEILETFITTGSDGGCLIYTEATSRLISLALRAGVAVNEIVEQLDSTHSCPAYQLARGRGKEVSLGKSCPSAIAKRLAEIAAELSPDHGAADKESCCPQGEKAAFSLMAEARDLSTAANQ